MKARISGARAVISNHEQFGALCAALVAEKMGWPGTSVEAVLACQHKLYAREVLELVAPEANVGFRRLEAAYDADIPEGRDYPSFVKPVKAAFSVLARKVHSRQALFEHTRFSRQELWVIRHLVAPFEKVVRSLSTLLVQETPAPALTPAPVAPAPVVQSAPAPAADFVN